MEDMNLKNVNGMGRLQEAITPDVGGLPSINRLKISGISNDYGATV